MSDHDGFEMRTQTLLYRLNDRVLEVFGLESDYNMRLHVDSVGFGMKDPDKHGKVRVVTGRTQDGEMSLGSERVGDHLDPVEWARFQAFVAAVKRVQAAGPEAW